ncbi:DUF3281 domain-containing protein [Allofrancisella frigidaquae]|uniref:DUF3281 domain-containing protein n=1 Tax=Allofrancisella frigidaquae TaxID=1085644 RepID=A0A6M3HZ26_9GAMM|nr:DUF3281 domain-containing protein [Allofrancisella frigidaquae]
MLGTQKDQILKAEAVGSNETTQFNITWSISGGDYATSQQMTDANLTACEEDACTNTANPTGYVFASPGAYNISVSVTITNDDGNTVSVSESTTVEVEAQPGAYSHVFKRTASPALPDGQTMQEVVSALNQNAASANGAFFVTTDQVSGLETWAIICNAGYNWQNDQDPEWGAVDTSSDSRNTSVTFWNGTRWQSNNVNQQDTMNGFFSGDNFSAGCWPNP